MEIKAQDRLVSQMGIEYLVEKVEEERAFVSWNIPLGAGFGNYKGADWISLDKLKQHYQKV